MGRHGPAAHPVQCSSKGQSGHQIPRSFPLPDAAGSGHRASPPNVSPADSLLLICFTGSYGYRPWVSLHRLGVIWTIPLCFLMRKIFQFDVIFFFFWWKKRSLRIRQLPHGNKVLTGSKMTLTIRTNHLRDMENYCQVMPSTLLFALLRHIEVMGQHPLILTTNKTLCVSQQENDTGC